VIQGQIKWAESLKPEKGKLSKVSLILYHVKICVFQVSGNIGFTLIPWGLLGELYPTKVAGLAGNISVALANLMGFAAIKLYPGFVDLVRGDNPTTGGGFFFFGTVSCVAVVFVVLFMPETFNKSLEQVSEEFRQPCRRNVWCR
jgi:SP family facilitated glucose transporter-like MFS transporter 8